MIKLWFFGSSQALKPRVFVHRPIWSLNHPQLRQLRLQIWRLQPKRIVLCFINFGRRQRNFPIRVSQLPTWDFFSKNNCEKRRSEDFSVKNKSSTNLCFIDDFEWLMFAWITRWILDHRDFSKKTHRMPTKPPPSPMTSRFSSRSASRENLGKREKRWGCRRGGGERKVYSEASFRLCSCDRSANIQ